MIPHHEQAIELSKLVPDRSTNPDLVALASQIASVQQPEINIMNVFLVQWNENPEAGIYPGDGHAGHGQTMQGMVDDATMAKLESLKGVEFDRLWLQSMISHHQGAIEMAKAEIANGKNIDAIAMATTIVKTQQAEIEQMKTDAGRQQAVSQNPHAHGADTEMDAGDPNVHGYSAQKENYAKRLRRIEGQVRGIAKMIDEDKYCIDILTQISAVNSALQSVALGLLDEHLGHCVSHAVAEGGSEADAKLAEASAAIARLVRS